MASRIFQILAVFCIGGSMSVGAQGGDIAVTVYNSGTALIREQREIQLEEGVNQIAWRDVAETIDASSVAFRSLSDPAATVVLEQSSRADQSLIKMLLAQNLDQSIEITDSEGATFSGRLLSLDGDDAVVQTGPSEIAVIRLHAIRALDLPALPADLYSGPALQLTLNSARAGQQDVELTYLAGGINWSADYNLILNADETALDLRGMITLSNYSGRAFSEANLKLIAGAVNRIRSQAEFAESRMMAMSADAAAESDFVAERGAFEYKLYEIARPLTISENEIKQIAFISGTKIPAQTGYRFDSSPAFRGYYAPIDYLEGYEAGSADVLTYLEFSTGEASGAGADLPAGRIRVYQADRDGSIILIGENTIDHSPKGEGLRLQLGAAFDLVGERTRSNFERESRTKVVESFEIRLRNHKAGETVEIRVPERLYRWSDWQISESSAPFEKLDAASIEFVVAVAPGAEEVLTYTVQYTFPEEGS